jgi:uncharacterized SAM-binding protein YcdF (DUF218 family)
MVRNIRRRRIIDTVRDLRAPFGGAAPHDIGVADAPRLGQPPTHSWIPNPYVTAFELIIFTLFALFFAVFVLRRRTRVPVGLFSAVLLWLLATGWAAAPLLDAAQSGAPDSPHVRFGPRSVIVVLGSGTEYDAHGRLIPKKDASARIVKAASVYAQCKAAIPRRECHVLLSGGNPQRHEASEADTYAPYLLRLHVEPTDIALENRSRNTYENAKFVARMLRDRHYDSLILVTSAYQMPRALLDFDRFGLSVQPVVSNTRHVRCGALPRLSNLVNANIALHELIGIAQFHVYRALGWF